MSEFTKGPWIQDKWGHVRQQNGAAVPFGAITLAMSNSDEIRANDRLVCAAPELLGALQDFVAYAESCDDDSPELDQARAAIKKALGQQ